MTIKIASICSVSVLAAMTLGSPIIKAQSPLPIPTIAPASSSASSTSPVARTTGAIMQLPVACIANMENGGHAFKQGPRGTNMAVLTDAATGQRLAVGFLDIDWIQRAPRISASAAYPSVLATSGALDYVHADVTSGKISGKRSAVLDICMRENFAAVAADSRCGPMPRFGVEGGVKPVDRPYQITGMTVDLEISRSGDQPRLKILSYTGALPKHSSRDSLVLSCVHPLYVPFLQGKVSGGATLTAEDTSYETKTFNDFQSPLVINLSQTGSLQLTDVQNENISVLFDPTGAGEKVRTGWVKPVDGLLALDFNSNGKVDNGSELFGEFTTAVVEIERNSWVRKFANGFQALQQFDENMDGIIDSDDPVYKELLIWRDQNLDGFSQKSELTKVAAVGLHSFNLAYKKTSNIGAFPKVAGNEVRFTSNAKLANGKSILVGDVWFRYQPVNRTESTSEYTQTEVQMEAGQ